METSTKLFYLRIALVLIGLIFIFGIYLLMNIWPAGFAWEPRQSEYEQMIVGVYATLDVFLLVAAKDPMKHLSLIWFTCISSLVHGGIMLVQALMDKSEMIHLLGDVSALLLVGIVLAILTPRKRV